MTKNLSVSLKIQHESRAFPENMLDSPKIVNKVECVKVSLRNNIWKFTDGKESDKVLPELFNVFDSEESRISFVISTNAPRITVQDDESVKICELCKDDLLEDGRVNKDILETRNEKDAWEKFEATIENGVDVRFLFT